jgi:hypothetical protein
MWIKLKRNDIIGAIFFAAFVVGTSLIYQFEERFNQEDWHDNPPQRHKLVDDLIERELLIGKTKAEVVLILGQPNSDPRLKNHIFSYDIGQPPSFTKSKPQQLLIVFKNERVFTIEVIE